MLKRARRKMRQKQVIPKYLQILPGNIDYAFPRRNWLTAIRTISNLIA